MNLPQDPKNKSQEPHPALPTPRGEVSEYIYRTNIVLEDHSAKTPKIPRVLSPVQSGKKSQNVMRLFFIVLGVLILTGAVYFIWMK